MARPTKRQIDEHRLGRTGSASDVPALLDALNREPRSEVVRTDETEFVEPFAGHWHPLRRLREEIATQANLYRATIGRDGGDVNPGSERRIRDHEAASLPPLPPFTPNPVSLVAEPWAMGVLNVIVSGALAHLAATGKLYDLWCCPSCRHFFVATHSRQEFCSKKCWPARKRRKRDRTEAVRKHRAKKRAEQERERSAAEALQIERVFAHQKALKNSRRWRGGV